MRGCLGRTLVCVPYSLNVPAAASAALDGLAVVLRRPRDVIVDVPVRHGNWQPASGSQAERDLAERIFPEEKTENTYWDSGSIYAALDPHATKTRYEYTAEGWQSLRSPETAVGSGVIDSAKLMAWRYLSDGLLKEQSDEAGQRASFVYDANGNRTSATEASGLTGVNPAPITVTSLFDGFDQPTRICVPGTGNLSATGFAYDQHANTTTLTQNAEDSPACGTQVSGVNPRLQTYTYDAADRATGQIDDFGTPTPTTDDEQFLLTWKATGWEEKRTVQKRPSGSWVDEQSTERTYFDNGLLKQLTSKNASATVIEQHTLDYITAGIYVNGNRVKDVFKLVGPDASAPCDTATCTATWTYDARERATQEVSGTGNTTDFTLDTVGNVTLEKVNAVTTRTAVYSGQQLLTEDAGGTNRRFFYDVLGNQDCVTRDTYAGTHCPGPGADLLEDPIYDYKNRLSSFRKYSNGNLDRKTDYTIDPLDRPVKLAEWNGATTTTTDLVYIGISNAVAKETLTGGTSTTKTYAYDPLGRRVTMSEGTLPHRYSYLNDAHGSVSMVLENDNTVKAAYGYTGYGSPNSSLTKLAAGFSADTNMYRYSGKRFDTNSDSYDMGARRYSASRGRFIQRDYYGDALANLGLSEDPLTGNRYALAAGNPVNFVELDGHVVYDPFPGGIARSEVEQAEATRQAIGEQHRRECIRPREGGYDVELYESFFCKYLRRQMREAMLEWAELTAGGGFGDLGAFLWKHKRTIAINLALLAVGGGAVLITARLAIAARALQAGANQKRLIGLVNATQAYHKAGKIISEVGEAALGMKAELAKLAYVLVKALSGPVGKMGKSMIELRKFLLRNAKK